MSKSDKPRGFMKVTIIWFLVTITIVHIFIFLGALSSLKGNS